MKNGTRTHRSFFAGEHKVSLIENRSTRDLSKAFNVADLHKRVMSGGLYIDFEGLDVIREQVNRKINKHGSRSGQEVAGLKAPRKRNNPNCMQTLVSNEQTTSRKYSMKASGNRNTTKLTGVMATLQSQSLDDFNMAIGGLIQSQ